MSWRRNTSNFSDLRSARTEMVYIYSVHRQALGKAKKKLRELTSRSQGRNARQVMENVKVYIRGWIGYFYVADMKRILQSWNEWLRRRMRMYIWKQWKKPNDVNSCRFNSNCLLCLYDLLICFFIIMKANCSVSLQCVIYLRCKECVELFDPSNPSFSLIEKPGPVSSLRIDY